MRPVLLALFLTAATTVRVDAQRADSLTTRALGRGDLTLHHVRAHDQLRTRERPSDMVKRREAAGEQVLAAVNADFFDLKSGENENNQVIAGEWWKGVKVTESPFDTFDNAHAQFGLDSANHPLLDRFLFEGEARTAKAAFPLITLNAVPTGPEGATLYTVRFGAKVPREIARRVQETGQDPDNAPGAVLVGYGRTARDVGGWPRIIRDGRNIAANSATEEGTIAGNAMARHPRTAVGFSRDSTTLFLVTVDGRSQKSVGMTTVELADFLLGLGAWQAMNFDGGGSTTMVVEDAVVNSPTDPTGEREVGNALLLVRTHARPAAKPE